MSRFHRTAVIVTACAACGPGEPALAVNDAAPTPGLGSLVTTIRTGSLQAPDTFAAGWTRIRLATEGEGGHNLIVLRLDSAGSESIERVRLALDTARGTPAAALALGGPEGPQRPGDTTEVILHLAPGRHALTCLRRDEDGHRHALGGEWRELVVIGDSTPAPAPPGTATISMVDFAFTGPAEWPAGKNLLHASNDGAQDHLFILRRLDDGVTLRQWLEAERPGQVSSGLGGLGRIGPGRSAYFPVTLTPGTYVLICLIPERESGRPHSELGMFREVQVR
jgi:uncharacterized cupredoxin-like copper-binding protein